MKAHTLVGLAVVAAVGAVPSAPAAGLKPTVLKKLTPQYNKNATRAIYMWGPFKLPPSNAKHAATGMSLSGIKLDPNSDTPGGNIVPPCADCTVHNAMANFAYKDGVQTDVANGVYIHHIIIADFSGKMQLGMPVQPPRCPKGGAISPIPPMTGMGPKAKDNKAGSGNSMADGHSHAKRQSFGMSVFIGGGGSVGSGNPFSTRPGTAIKSGYYIGKGGNMQLTSEIVNYDPKEKEIYLTLDMEWSAGKDKEMYDVGMGALSADNCLDKERGILHPPKDKAIVYKGEKWTVTEPGYFINFTPHIHDGGVNVKVFINDKEVCEAKAIYGEETKALDGNKWQTITGYTPCEGAFKIAKGDMVHMTSEYDLTKYRLRPDNAHADAEAEGMALANFIWAKPYKKGLFG